MLLIDKKQRILPLNREEYIIFLNFFEKNFVRNDCPENVHIFDIFLEFFLVVFFSIKQLMGM